MSGTAISCLPRGVPVIRALFCFEHEASAFIEVDPAGAGLAIAVMEGDAALKNIGVLAVIRRGGIGTRNLHQVAEF